MKTVREGSVTILPRDNDIVDVFTGQGWENHSVFKIEKGWPKLVDGPGVTEAEFKFVRKAMNG